MPLYSIASKKALSPDQCSHIAKAVTDVHCQVTDAPPEFVNVLFTIGRSLPWGKAITIAGGVRKGGNRDAEMFNTLHTTMCEQVAVAIGVSPKKVGLELIGIQASWNMEGGRILPDPGDEDDWLSNA